METDPAPFLSLVIPAHNEEGNIERTCRGLHEHLSGEGIHDFEILVVNDNSSDNTEAILQKLQQDLPTLRYINNQPPNGFGFAVRRGLSEFKGEAVAVVMADLSDAPEDVAQYYHKLQEGWECVFGSRFISGGHTYDYPRVKMILNRIFNWGIKVLFRLDHNDVTNAFKAYRRNVIEGIQPLFSHHFNLTVELPLKAIVRGYTYTRVPISWTNRDSGESKLKLKEMGSRYIFIVLYVFLEKLLSRGDYVRKDLPPKTC